MFFLLLPFFFFPSSGSESYRCPVKESNAQWVRYAKEFRPSRIGLDKCPLDSFTTFFSRVDIDCLRSLPHYKYGVLLVMLKLYDYHISKAHQGYDLYSMKNGTSKTLIDEFELIGGYNKGSYDMLNSGTVLDVIDKDKQLAADPSFQRYLHHIRKKMKFKTEY
jgi:hypothetical protein